jgi:hypothetical protein
MSQISPVITKETTMWRCWVGFNASHSMGLILFGLVFGYLALAHGQLLFQSPFLLVVGLALLGGLVVLCKAYFFSVPLTESAFLWPAISPALRYRGLTMRPQRKPAFRGSSDVKLSMSAIWSFCGGLSAFSILIE